MALKIFTGRSNEALARAIVGYIIEPTSSRKFDVGSVDDLKLGELDDKRGFPDGELYTRFCEEFFLKFNS